MWVRVAVGAIVSLACARASTAFVSALASHALPEHQHWWLVRTGESWSPASEREKCFLQPAMNASASLSLTKLLSVITHGEASPRLPSPGREIAFGLYCGK